MDPKYGEVKSFDRTTAKGKVKIKGEIFDFPSTVFLSKPTRFPRVGDKVKVYFNNKAEILVVEVVKKEDERANFVEGFRVNIQNLINKTLNKTLISVESLAEETKIPKEKLDSFFEDDCKIDIRELASIFYSMGYELNITAKKIEHNK